MPRVQNPGGQATTDNVTIQGAGTAASPIAIKAVQVDGTTITGAGTVASPLVATLQRPAGGSGVYLTSVAAQSIPNNTETAVTFVGATPNRDDGPYWSNATPTRFTAVTTGWYQFSGDAQFAANNTGIRQVAVRVDGFVDLFAATLPVVGAIATPLVFVAGAFYLVATHYLELTVIQTSGGALNISVADWSMVSVH